MHSSKPTGLQTIFLYCGILSSLLYVVTDIVAANIWESYSYSDQTVSELFAIDAPTRQIVVPAFIIYSILIYLFGFGVWQSSGSKRALRFAAVLIIGKEVLGLLGTLFAPIHLRGVPGTISDTMHALITGVGVFLFMFPAMVFGAKAFGKKFRIYTIVTIILFLVFGALAGMMGAALAANQPTPLMGIWERINIYGYMLWVVIFSIMLMRSSSMKI